MDTVEESVSTSEAQVTNICYNEQEIEINKKVSMLGSAAREDNSLVIRMHLINKVPNKYIVYVTNILLETTDNKQVDIWIGRCKLSKDVQIVNIPLSTEILKVQQNKLIFKYVSYPPKRCVLQ